MILIDTSVWIEHLRTGDRELAHLLDTDQALIHPFVIGELACGNLARRQEILAMLQDLPALPAAEDSEVLYFIGRNQLMGRGIGYIDMHLLAAAALAPPARLWTRDKRLGAAADRLGLAHRLTTFR
ncbi:MAG: type II toxin-antitoxin system VapC family toxin [Deltaproteobacteria bacterium]|nr:type II toxin-antitoxin system VapC family toxin [Deltaproteobacteria bacterium]